MTESVYGISGLLDLKWVSCTLPWSPVATPREELPVNANYHLSVSPARASLAQGPWLRVGEPWLTVRQRLLLQVYYKYFLPTVLKCQLPWEPSRVM